uniref:Mlh1_C domain-containing protein n=1 Tax=Heterorhabditis bacteriophora TaxID=37862 RepID=A0A1I7WM86_HETBA
MFSIYCSLHLLRLNRIRLVRTDTHERRLDEFLVQKESVSLENVEIVAVSSSQLDNVQYEEVISCLTKFDIIIYYYNLYLLLLELFKSHTFVGCVSPEVILMQYSTALYLINAKEVMREMFYQACFPPLYSLFRWLFTHPIRVSRTICFRLTRTELYFLEGIKIDSLNIVSIPSLIDGYIFVYNNNFIIFFILPFLLSYALVSTYYDYKWFDYIFWNFCGKHDASKRNLFTGNEFYLTYLSLASKLDLCHSKISNRRKC